MRIIAGKWRGRKLAALKGDRIRPTADRVKEAMFSILGSGVQGATVLDLCCGTGGLGLEALSRGAAQVYFVDSSRRSLEQVRRNLDLLQVDRNQAVLCPDEAAAWLRRWSGAGSRNRWFVVSDPPYDGPTAAELLAGLVDRAADPLFRGAIIEHDRRQAPAIAEIPGAEVEVRSYGRCSLTILRPRAPQ